MNVYTKLIRMYRIKIIRRLGIPLHLRYEIIKAPDKVKLILNSAKQIK